MSRRHEPSRSKGNTSKTTGNDLESRLRSVAFQIADDFVSKHVFIDLLKLTCGGIKIAICKIYYRTSFLGDIPPNCCGFFLSSIDETSASYLEMKLKFYRQVSPLWESN